jgi:tRNA-2-methylthio-N6-dimethylallyladenosine synthase
MTLTRFQSEARAEDPVRAPKVHLVTFGCQMNKYDSLLAEGRFREQGYAVAPTIEEADVVLFNTCSVREHAEERTYSWLGELKREKTRRPELIIGVMGCLAQRAEDEVFSRAGHVDLVVGTRRFQHLPQLVEEVRQRRAALSRSGAPLAPWNSKGARVLDVEMDDAVAVDRSREVYTGGLEGFLAVMRGCDLNCTYCIVPKTRGRVQSRPISELVAEARWMVSQSARVVTLLGQTVNSYGEDLPVPSGGEPRQRGRQGRPSLADLLYELQGIEGLLRIRLITLHPAYVTRALAEAIRDNPKVERFLPLPAQAGSDPVLRAMKRGYTTDLYRQRVEILREIVPDIELGSDWIVGFPGESDQDFERSLAFLAEIGFAQNYIFKYDPRPETAAHALPDDVPVEVKKARNQALLSKAHRVQLLRHQQHLGRRLEVIGESLSERHPGWLQGRSQHGLPVSFAVPPELSPQNLIGRVQVVTAEEATAFGVSGSSVRS